MVQKKVHILTYGCQMNVSDSERIAASLRHCGYTETELLNEADMVILNTCSVRAKAEDRIYGILHTMKGQLKKNPDLIIGVGGCVAQQEGKLLLEKVPHLRFVFGTHNLHLLPQIIEAAESGRRLAETDFIDDDKRFDLYPQNSDLSGVTRFITIMQGCDNFCSYCIVPYVRGREVSRRPEDIITEVRLAVEAGVKEVTLLGQNVNSYMAKSGDGSAFAELLCAIAGIDGIARVRFMTSHPKDISTPLIECFAGLDKLCSHIHLPVQAGSDRILQLMNRGYTRSDYLHMIGRLREVRPDMLVTSDLIVGFPGETEEDFRQTLDLMEEVGYSDSYSFVYSPRPETRAALLPDKATKEEKHQRLDRLLKLQKKLTSEVQAKFLGKRVEVLVEGPGKIAGQIYGRTSGNRVVNFAGEPSLAGSLQSPLIIRNNQNSLLGRLEVIS